MPPNKKVTTSYPPANKGNPEDTIDDASVAAVPQTRKEPPSNRRTTRSSKPPTAGSHSQANPKSPPNPSENKTRAPRRTKAEIAKSKEEETKKKELKAADKKKKELAIVSAKKITQEKIEKLRQMEEKMKNNSINESFLSHVKATGHPNPNSLSQKVVLTLGDQENESEAEETIDAGDDSADDLQLKYVTVSPRKPGGSLDDRMDLDGSSSLTDLDYESDKASLAASRNPGRRSELSSQGNADSLSMSSGNSQRRTRSVPVETDDEDKVPVVTKKQRILLTAPSDDVDVDFVDDNGVKKRVSTNTNSTPTAYHKINSEQLHRASNLGKALVISSVRKSVEGTIQDKDIAPNQNLLTVPARNAVSRAKAFRNLTLNTNVHRSRSGSPWSGMSNLTETDSESHALAQPKPVGKEPKPAANKDRSLEQQEPATSARVTKATAVVVKVKSELRDLAAEDTTSKKGDDGKVKRFVMEDLGGLNIDRRIFRRKLLPSYYELMMSLSDPFDTHDPTIIPLLQRIYDTIFPSKSNSHQITEQAALKYIVDQRYMEYRRRFADYGSAAVKRVLENYDEEYVVTYVQKALSVDSNGHPEFIWKNFMSEEFLRGDRKGVFRNPMIIDILAHHLYEIRNAIDTEPPIEQVSQLKGAAALALCALERAFSFWRSGTYYEEKDKKKKLKSSFSGDNFAEKFQGYLSTLEGILPSHWRLFMRDVKRAFEDLSARMSADGDSDVTDLTGDEDLEGERRKLLPSELAALDQDSELEDFQ